MAQTSSVAQLRRRTFAHALDALGTQDPGLRKLDRSFAHGFAQASAWGGWITEAEIELICNGVALDATRQAEQALRDYAEQIVAAVKGQAPDAGQASAA